MLKMISDIINVFSQAGNVLTRSSDTNNIANIALEKSKKIGFFQRWAIKHSKFKDTHLWYGKLYEKAGKAFSFLSSSKVYRVVTIAGAVFGLATSFLFPPLAIGLTAAALIGVTSSLIADTIQKRNLKKVQKEEKALERVIKSKKVIVDLAKTVDISIDMAKKIGLTSILIREDQDKLSKNPRKDIIRKITNLKAKEARGGLSAEEKTHLSSLEGKLRLLKRDTIANEKNDDGRTSARKAIRKTLFSRTIEWGGNVAAVLLNAFNPVAFCLVIVSTFASLVSEGAERKKNSNQKQELKKAIEVFRQRLDVPGYDSVEEIEKISRTAQLEAKALKSLSENEEFKQYIRGGEVEKAKDMIRNAKYKIVLEKEKLRNYEPLKQFHKKCAEMIQKKSEEYLAEHYNELHEHAESLLGNGASEKKIIKAIHELAKLKVTEEVSELVKAKKSQIKMQAVGSIRIDELVGAADKDYIIAGYENQGTKTSLGKAKEFMGDLLDTANVFKTESFAVEKPHKLISESYTQAHYLHHEEQESRNIDLAKSQKSFDRGKKLLTDAVKNEVDEISLTLEQYQERASQLPIAIALGHNHASFLSL